MQRTILIADDNEINRRILRKILGGEYEVLEACDGQEALDILAEKHHILSAVLLDIVMPVMDGYQVLDRMQASPELAQIPVIVTTGNTDSDSEMKALTLGANDYVTKPYNPDIIKRRLHNTIRLRETAAIINAIQRDQLTGLYNRETFFAKVEEMAAQQPPGYYMMTCFDIDNFKVINDQFGNAKGDQVLQQLAAIFRDGFEPRGGVCCRVMADQFAVLYPSRLMNCPEILEIHQTAMKLDGSIRPISFSVGRYLVDDLSLSGSAMYDRALIAASSIKARFDQSVAQYDESMRQHLLREQEIIDEMEQALHSEQFKIWIQPQYNHSSGALIGGEALARWEHPQRGLISPAEFIPVFEKNGFVYELDKCIWEQTCALLRRWLDEGLEPLPLSVNVSRYDVFREDFFSVITGLIRRYRIPLDLLRLEITESAFATSTQQIIDMVKRLISFGFILEIDDFGSGYSSLNTLKDVPADILKLDMRFLENEDNSTRGGNILESIIRMAKWLGMRVIAEGVETRQQADYLRSIGCFYVQGFLYSRPMPISAYEELAARCATERPTMTLQTVETLDNDSFWDPKSLETLIFNSYVGGACIFEYYDSQVELLRVNEKYAQELGGPQMTMEQSLAIDLAQHLDEAGMQLLMENIMTAMMTDSESTAEFRMFGVPGQPGDVYIRSTVRMIARAGERMLFYCTIANITAQREAEQKERKSAERVRFLNDTSHELLAQPDMEQGINSVLQKLLGHFQADRAYVVEMDAAKDVCHNTYEVCSPGVSSEMANLQQVPLSDFAFWWEAFEQVGYVNIKSVAALDESREEERQILEAQNISSLIEVPMYRDGQLIGFIGVDNPRHNHEQVEQLRAIGDYIAVILTRRDLTRRIAADHKRLQDLMNDTPGGFVRLKLREDGSLTPVYINQGFLELTGMTEQQHRESYEQGLLQRVHPDDVPVLEATIEEIRREGQVRSAKYRLRRDDGSYFWVTIFVRRTTGEDGQVFYNIYYTDLSEQEKQELTFREMLAAALRTVMASSTDISFVKDRELRYICGSQPMLKLCYLDSEEQLVGKTDAELFHESWAAEILAEDMQLIESQRSLIDNIETFRRRDGAVEYYSTSKYPLKDSRGQVMGIYGISRDITRQMTVDEALRIREEEYQLAITHSGKLVYRYSHADNAIELQPNTADLFDLPARVEDVPDSLIREGGVAPQSADAYVQFYRGIRRGDKTGSMTILRRVKGGSYRWFHCRFSNIFDDGGMPVSAIVVVEDITEQRQEHIGEALDRMRLMTALRTIYPVAVSVNLSQNTYHTITGGEYLFIPNAGQGVYNDLIYAGAERMTSKYGDAFIGQFAAEALLQRLVKAGDSLSMEYQQISYDGDMHWLETTVLRVENSYDSDVMGVLLTRAIDEQKKTEDKLRLADMDGMTGIYNKSTTEALIKRRLSRADGSPCTLLIADLDNLKNINDNYGHDLGDEAIRTVAAQLREHFRKTDIVGRVGGDEFAVFLDGGGNEARLRSTMTALLRKLQALRIGSGRNIPLHGSIGICCGVVGRDSYHELFKKADRALYHVKRNGKNDYAFYTPEMEQDAYQYQSQAESLRLLPQSFDSEEMNRLLQALAAIYPLVISVNLSQNSYYMLQYQDFYTTVALEAGSYDDLIGIGAATFAVEDQASFIKAFNRESLLAAEARGEKTVSHIGRQMGDDGQYRLMHTETIFVHDQKSADILLISLAREIETAGQ